jgi:hypothetical protein
MTLPVTVCTASMPSRHEHLARCQASVRNQTVQPAAHLIRIAQPLYGQPNPHDLAMQRNRLLGAVDTEWLAVLDDDDLYLPHHFETIQHALTPDADMVYTFANEGVVARENVNGMTHSQILARLATANFMNANACLRVDTLLRVGGWEEEFDFATRRFASGAAWEDWGLWIRMAKAGAKFVCIPQGTYDYLAGAPERATDVWRG